MAVLKRTFKYQSRRGSGRNKKTLLWYDRSRKITKPICVRRDSGRANLANSGDRAKGMSGSEDARP